MLDRTVMDHPNFEVLIAVTKGHDYVVLFRNVVPLGRNLFAPSRGGGFVQIFPRAPQGPKS